MKYSSLDQINRDNVSELRIAWRQSAIPVALRDGLDIVNVPANYQHTPPMVGGKLFMQTAPGNVAALDPVTGKVIWAQDSPERGGCASRSLAYGDDGADSRIVVLHGQLLLALNARTGVPIVDFGASGQVDLARITIVLSMATAGEGRRWSSAT
jgi:quinoprotein glucose dehydrogenase